MPSARYIYSYIFTVLKPFCTAGSPLLASQVSGIIRSLPLLEDLGIRSFGIRDDDENGITFQPQTSPPLTGELELCLVRGVESIARRLLDLPNGIRFWKFARAWYRLEDLQWITALVGGCAESLEHFHIKCRSICKFLFLHRRVSSRLNVCCY